MSELTWQLDAGTGTYRNSFASRELYEAAFADTHLVPWTTPVGGFGKGMGETVDLYTVTGPSEPSSALLNETVRIPEDTLAISSSRLTMKEYGRAITFTNKYTDLSRFKMEPIINKRLKEQLRLVMDTLAATAGFSTSTKVAYIPTGVASAVTNDTDGTPSTTALANINLYHLQRMRDQLYGVYLAPPISGGNYVYVTSYVGMRGLRDDPNWQQWKVYQNPEALASGEVGLIENIRCIETNHTATGAFTAVGSGSVLGRGLLLADEAIAFAEAVTPELRMKPKDDYGRLMGVAWYGMLDFGIYHPTANAGEVRIIKVDSL